ncbi:MAG: hypothetical protein HY363_01830 [Candidatus Aenigmarchaeota archaeon]|nr:hypothetical protein [Candidatus Aenigmarchaeota archaeon]
MSYNICYNWIATLIQKVDRKQCPISITEHCWERTRRRKICDANIAVYTVRHGKIAQMKSTYPNRICFIYHEGKSNTTYETIGEFGKHCIEVVTIWKSKGKN